MKLLKLKDHDIAQERIESALRMLEDPELEYTALDSILCAVINFIDQIDDESVAHIKAELQGIRGNIEGLYNDGG